MSALILADCSDLAVPVPFLSIPILAVSPTAGSASPPTPRAAVPTPASTTAAQLIPKLAGPHALFSGQHKLAGPETPLPSGTGGFFTRCDVMVDSEWEFSRARNLLYLQNSGIKLAKVSEDWLLKYVDKCTPEKVKLLNEVMDELGIGI